MSVAFLEVALNSTKTYFWNGIQLTIFMSYFSYAWETLSCLPVKCNFLTMCSLCKIFVLLIIYATNVFTYNISNSFMTYLVLRFLLLYLWRCRLALLLSSCLPLGAPCCKKIQTINQVCFSHNKYVGNQLFTRITPYKDYRNWTPDIMKISILQMWVFISSANAIWDVQPSSPLIRSQRPRQISDNTIDKKNYFLFYCLLAHEYYSLSKYIGVLQE